MRRSIVPVGAAVAAVAVCGSALVAVTSCRDAGGVREEGTVLSSTLAVPAPLPTGAAPTPPARKTSGGVPPAAARTPVADAVRLVKSDPKVAEDIRARLVACVAASSVPGSAARDGSTGTVPAPRTPAARTPVPTARGAEVLYPVDDRYGDLTGRNAADLVVTVSTCGDGVGIGAYVYRREHGKYVNVFADEQPPVYAEISDSSLKVTHQVYEPQDAVSNPSGEDITTYRWNGTRFEETSFSHRDYEAGDEDTSHG
ncbi:hypothetical protein ACIP98_24310 [Streptomyces sp. NPDC088354]|uniref:hypothetical protein n=1 Tax=Streptomyces sp. NPDC088354 TaxID=3365856 RepID=UPI0037FAA28F